MRSIKKVLIERDGMTEAEAEELIKEAQEDLQERIANGRMHLIFAKNILALNLTT